MNNVRNVLVVVSLLCCSLVCRADATTGVPVAQAMPAAVITVEDGWVRASMPGAGNSVAFLTVKNSSSVEQRIVAVSCVVAKRCEMHQHTHSGGKMRMEKVDQLVVPAGASLALASGGYHIMLLELVAPLAPGAGVELVFTLADQTTHAFTLPVKSVHEE